MQNLDIGVFSIDKPEGFTSFDVVAKLRGILKIKRIGHGGTLDPIATGVLPIFIGKATRAVDLLSDNQKQYTATARIGIKTDTGDISGQVIEESNVVPSEEELERAISKYLGNIEQIPPMYSAIKINGKPLYDIARSGKTVPRQPRNVEILSNTLLSYDVSLKEFSIDVICSKGTYIRTLVEQIAEETNSVATVTSLRRTKSGPFYEKDSLTFHDIEEKVRRDCYDFISPLTSLFSSLERIVLRKDEYILFLNGVNVASSCLSDSNDMFCVIYEDNLVALANIIDGKIKPITRFV